MSHPSTLVLLLGLLTFGCSASGIPVDDFNERARGIEIGMSKSQFLDAFPEATPRGAKKYSNGVVEVLEVFTTYHSFFPTGNPNRDRLSGIEGTPNWFYFFESVLIQYGRPDDWPKEADILIQMKGDA